MRKTLNIFRNIDAQQSLEVRVEGCGAAEDPVDGITARYDWSPMARRRNGKMTRVDSTQRQESKRRMLREVRRWRMLRA